MASGALCNWPELFGAVALLSSRSRHGHLCTQVKVVVGIRNDATEAYNITSIMGSVNSPADFKTYIHNLTHQVRGCLGWRRDRCCQHPQHALH